MLFNSEKKKRENKIKDLNNKPRNRENEGKRKGNQKKLMERERERESLYIYIFFRIVGFTFTGSKSDEMFTKRWAS